MTEYPPDWDVAELGSIGLWMSGGTPSTNSPAYWDGSIPWISATSLKSFDIRDSERKVTELGANSGTRRVPTGTVIFVVRGMSLKTEFRVGVTAREVTFGQDCKAIQVPVGINSRFLAYVLKANEAEILSMVDEAGHGTGRLPTQQFVQLRIGFPQESEQDQILEILDSIDESIRSTKRLIGKLDQVKSGLVEDLISRGIDGRGRESWPLRQLGEIAELITSGSRGWGSRYSDSGAIFVRIGNLTRKNIDLRLDKIVRVAPPDNSEVLRTALRPSDILISITADIGMIGVVPSGLGEAYVNQHVAMVRPREGGVALSRWIGYYLSAQRMQDWFRSLNDSGAKAGLNLSSVSRLEVAVPEDPYEISRMVAVLDQEALNALAIEVEFRKLVQLKRSLMEDLLMARVRVNMGPQSG